MWLEVKAVFTLIAAAMIAIVMAMMMGTNIIFVFLLFMALFLFILGDIVIGMKITNNHLNVLMDPLKADEELCVLFTIGNLIDFIKTKKGPLGKREFVYHRKEASAINDGTSQIHTINGNLGFIGHESYDRNVNLRKAKALEQFKGDDVKEIYHKLKGGN